MLWHTASTLSWLRARIDIVVPVIASICAGILVTIVTSKRIDIVYDSTLYLSAADNFADGRGLRAFGGESLVIFPPGYPTVLAILVRLGFASVDAARIVNIISAVLTVILVAAIAKKYGPRGSAALASALLVLTPAFTRMHFVALSEPLFTIGLLAAGLGLVRAPRTAEEWRPKHFVLPIVGSWIACWTRYVGWVVIIGACVLLLTSVGRLASRLRISLTYLVGAAIVPAGVLIYNFQVSGVVWSPASPPRSTIESDIVAFLEVAGGSLVEPLRLDTPAIRAVVGAVAIFGVCAVGTLALRRRFKDQEPSVSLVLPLLMIGFMGFNLVAARRVWLEINARIVYPILPVLMVIGVVAVLHLIERSSPPRRIALSASALVLSVAAVIQLPGEVRELRDSSFVLPKGTEALPEIAREVKSLPFDAHIYTNNLLSLHLATGRPLMYRIVPLLPKSSDAESVSSSQAVKRQDRFNEHACEGLYIVWDIAGSSPSYALLYRQLQKLPDLYDVSMEDIYNDPSVGEILFVEANDRSDCSPAKRSP